MSTLTRVLLLYGGKSGEHEVSLCSAASVLSNLDFERYQVIPVAIDKQGCLHLHHLQDVIGEVDKLPVQTALSQPLPSLLVDGKLAIDADVVFPIVHGPLYEDGCLQGLLRHANVAFVGSDVLSSGIGMDKDIARRLAALKGWASTDYQLISSLSTQEQKEERCKEAVAAFGWPLFVKPCSLGSSVGTHKVNSFAELINAVNDATRYDESILVEKYVQGREIEFAVLQEDESRAPLVSVAGEIKVNNTSGFYSYAAKYLNDGQTDLIVPAALNQETLLQFQKAAAEIFQALKCSGLARVDFFLKQDNKIIFNEINTLPGFTIWSMYPKLLEASGISYRQLLDKLIHHALIRHQHRQNIVTDYS